MKNRSCKNVDAIIYEVLGYVNRDKTIHKISVYKDADGILYIPRIEVEGAWTIHDKIVPILRAKDGNFIVSCELVNQTFYKHAFSRWEKSMHSEYERLIKYSKGRPGEDIAEKIYKSYGWEMRPYAGNRKGIVDFRITFSDSDYSVYAEVKLRTMWNNNDEIGFSLPKRDIEKYKNFSWFIDTEILISIIDQNAAMMYNCPLSDIIENNPKEIVDDNLFIPAKIFWRLPVEETDAKRLRAIAIN